MPPFLVSQARRFRRHGGEEMTAQERESLLERIAAHAEDVPEIQTALTACRAVGPENGGHGEGAKAGLIEKWLRDMGISGIEHVDAPDGRVPGGKRPNLIATIPGRGYRFVAAVDAQAPASAGDTGPQSSPLAVEPPMPDLDLQLAFRQLPANTRLALTLFYYEGYGVQEIAQIVGEPTGTIKSRLARGREQLRHKLEKGGRWA